jgi:hypothetical protein
MRRLWIAYSFSVLAVCALSACGSSSVGPQTPKTVRRSIVAAALAQKSVHWDWDVGSQTEAFESSADLTADSGVRQVRYFCCTKNNDARVRILLVDHTVYVRGDAPGLHITLGFHHAWLTNAKARTYAWQWISIPRGDRLYSHLAADLLLGSVVRQFTPRAGRDGKLRGVAPAGPTGPRGPTGPGRATAVSVEPMTSGGKGSFSVLADGPTGESPSFHANGEPRPIAFSQACDFCGDDATFSRWNEPVHVTAPSHAIPIATVRAS